MQLVCVSRSMRKSNCFSCPSSFKAQTPTVAIGCCLVRWLSVIAYQALTRNIHTRIYSNATSFVSSFSFRNYSVKEKRYPSDNL